MSKLQPIEGYLLSLEPSVLCIELAKHFCVLASDQQAQFFNKVAEITSSPEWGGRRIYQWRYIRKDLTDDGKRLIDELKVYTDP